MLKIGVPVGPALGEPEQRKVVSAELELQIAHLPENFHQVHRDWRGKKLTLREAAWACGMPPSTFYTKAVQIEKSV